MKKLLPSRLTEGQHGQIAFVFLAIAFIAVALSFFWGVGTTTVSMLSPDGAEIEKEAGFGLAFNWSIGLTLLLPAAILYLCKSYRSFLRVVREVAGRQMVLTDTLETVSPERLLNRWREILDSRHRWLLLLLVVGTLFSLWEWWDYSARPLLFNDVELAEEWDWSVGVLLSDRGEPTTAPPLARIKNASISLFAFVGQAFMIAVVLIFAYHALMVSSFFTRTAGPDGRLKLIPDPRSRDSRRGFELMAEFIEHSLILVAILYFLFYLSRIQNIFLRSDADSVLSFIRNDLLIGLVANPWDLGATIEVVRKGLEPAEAKADYSSIMVSLAAFGVMMVAAFMVGSTVRDAARTARQELLALVDSKGERLSHVLGVGPAEIEESMNGMVFWPVNYLRAGQFFGLVVLGVFCIFFYKLGVILLAFVLVRIFWEVARYIWGRRA